MSNFVGLSNNFSRCNKERTNPFTKRENSTSYFFLHTRNHSRTSDSVTLHSGLPLCFDDEIGTPISDHIKFPSSICTVRETSTTKEEKSKPAMKKRIISDTKKMLTWMILLAQELHLLGNLVLKKSLKSQFLDQLSQGNQKQMKHQGIWMKIRGQSQRKLTKLMVWKTSHHWVINYIVL